jgi:hypothetical protein
LADEVPKNTHFGMCKFFTFKKASILQCQEIQPRNKPTRHATTGKTEKLYQLRMLVLTKKHGKVQLLGQQRNQVTPQFKAFQLPR